MWTWVVQVALGGLWEFLKVLFSEAVKRELAAVMPIAADVVREVAADPTLLTSESKRSAALAKLGARLAAAHIAVGGSLLNFAVELAYQSFKREGGA